MEDKCLRCGEETCNLYFDGRLCKSCVVEFAQHLADEQLIREFCGQDEEEENNEDDND